jgi:Cysteine-rich CPCC
VFIRLTRSHAGQSRRVVGRTLLGADHAIGGNSVERSMLRLQTGSVNWWPLRRRRAASHEPGDGRVFRGPNDDPSLTDEELVARRTQWFGFYTSQQNVMGPETGGPYTFPVCGHLTLSERGGYEICPECGWEDDGQDDHDSHVVRVGPNGPISLDDARADYIAHGGTRLPHRPPSDPR